MQPNIGQLRRVSPTAVVLDGELAAAGHTVMLIDVASNRPLEDGLRLRPAFTGADLAETITDTIGARCGGFRHCRSASNRYGVPVLPASLIDRRHDKKTRHA